jgi:hypothetical protein
VTNILVEQFMAQGGLSREDATLVVDVASHAAEQAMRTIMRIIDTAPDEVAPQTFITALQITEGLIRAAVLDITNAPGVRVNHMRDPRLN